VKPKLVKTLAGKVVIKYRCFKCGDKLVSPLDDAGLKDTCPNCNTNFVVPDRVCRQLLSQWTKRYSSGLSNAVHGLIKLLQLI